MLCVKCTLFGTEYDSIVLYSTIVLHIFSNTIEVCKINLIKLLAQILQ